MNEKQIFDAMHQVDDQLVADAAPQQSRRSRAWVKWGALAACLLLVVGLALPLTLQQEEQPLETPVYNILIASYSDGVEDLGLRREFELWANTNEEIQESRKGELTTKIDKEEFCGEYEYSRIRTYDYFKTHAYDGEDFTFYVDDDQKLTGFVKRNIGEIGAVLSEEECVQIAKDFIGGLTNVEDYEVAVTYLESVQRYEVDFRKYVGEYATADSAWVTVNIDGSIKTFSSTMLGKIPVDAQFDFDLEAAEAQVTARLDELFEAKQENYDSIEYSFEFIVTMVSETEYALICNADIDCITYMGEYIEHAGGVITFALQYR